MELKNDAYRQVIESLHDGLYFVDKDRIITYWNKAAEEISGFSAEEVIGRSCANSILTHIDCRGCGLCNGSCPLAATMTDGIPRENDIYMHHKDGHRVPVSVRVSALTDENREVIGGIELFSDISSSRANELRVEELEKLALLDNLTQLANRNYIQRELESRFEEFSRYDVPFGILFLDIDHFKQFNDTYGHDIGDEVLKFVSQTLVSNARAFDLYGRWGGEEFLGIIRNITQKDLINLGNRMRMLIEKSYLTREGQDLKVTISLGATMVHQGDDMDSLIKRADQLLYESKDAGRNRLSFG